MKHNIETIKQALKYHWKHQDKVSFDVLVEEVEGFKKELQEKLPIYDCQGSWSPKAKQLIGEILGI